MKYRDMFLTSCWKTQKDNNGNALTMFIVKVVIIIRTLFTVVLACSSMNFIAAA